MAIVLNTRPAGSHSDTDDAIIRNCLFGGACGLLTPMTITVQSGNQVKISGGRMIICGRLVTMDAMTHSAALVSSGTASGRIYIELNLADTTAPVSVKSVAAETLPDLVQEEINRGGSVYQMELAAYTAGTTSVSDVKLTARDMSGGLPVVTVAETAPVNPSDGDLWVW